MSRCACAQATCQCVLQDSTTIDFSGAGSAASPYTGTIIPTAVAPLLLSTDAGNDLTLGSDGLIYDSGAIAVFSVRTIAVAGAFLVASDYLILANAAAAGFTVALPTAVGNAGRVFVLKKIDATVNPVVLDPLGAQTIDGALTFTLAFSNLSVMVISDGANWRVI